jgi:hypothetical protein
MEGGLIFDAFGRIWTDEKPGGQHTFASIHMSVIISTNAVLPKAAITLRRPSIVYSTMKSAKAHMNLWRVFEARGHVR